MKSRILSAFKKFNIDSVGITDASRYNLASNEEFKSIIVALFPYYSKEDENSNLSMYTYGKDYHKVIREILNAVCLDAGISDYKLHSDIGPEIERALAVDSGLCFVGKNGMCINEKYGSYFFIGYIVCNEDLPYDKPNEKNCLGCLRCINACPGNAISDGFNEEKCLSAITQKKGDLSIWEENLIRDNGSAFGCDVCQKVCPHNKGIKMSEIAEFTNDLITRLESEEISAMSNKEFLRKYGDRSFSWRGKKVLERNLKIIDEKTKQ